MTEKHGLLDQRVVIVLRRFHQQTPREMIRGIITEVDESGLRVSGRRFRETVDRESSLLVERPVEQTTKTYWVPYTSIRYSEIISPGSASEREDNVIQRRKPLSADEINRLPSS